MALIEQSVHLDLPGVRIDDMAPPLSVLQRGEKPSIMRDVIPEPHVNRILEAVVANGWNEPPVELSTIAIQVGIQLQSAGPRMGNNHASNWKPEVIVPALDIGGQLQSLDGSAVPSGLVGIVHLHEVEGKSDGTGRIKPGDFELRMHNPTAAEGAAHEQVEGAAPVFVIGQLAA